VLLALVAAIVISAPWSNGGTIPRRYTCDGADARPAISVAPRPSAFEVVDVDAPGGHFVHWLSLDGVDGRNSFGRIGWSGPCPPPGDPPHRYVLTAYELDRDVRLARGFDEARFLRALEGHVIARARLVGRYTRR
jgi:phosphatidylethanolamine-binding protein (PEBP) family uncharacterized protein